MPKNILFLCVTSLLILNSCGGGWSEEQKEQLKNQCIGSGSYDCDCYVDKVVKAHEDPETFNALSKEDKEKLVNSCVVEIESTDATDENLESF